MSDRFRAAMLLEEEMFPKYRCDNCNSPFDAGDKAYRIEKGEITELARQRVVDEVGRLFLCPRCYDNNWIIGEPDDV